MKKNTYTQREMIVKGIVVTFIGMSNVGNEKENKKQRERMKYENQIFQFS